MDIELRKVLMDIPLFGQRRTPVSETDFGDFMTIGLHLKKSGIGLDKASDYDFGIYLGKLKNGKWGVALKVLYSFVPQKLAEYDSLEELKRTWILD